MARINYPKDFLQRAELFDAVKAKHDKDGTKSSLTAFLSHNKIDLEANAKATARAISQNTSYEKAAKTAEDATEVRNVLFKPVFSNMKKSFQFLKGLYVGNPAELGHWGATVNKNAIKYPKDFLHRVELFKAMKKKHDSFPAGSSPLAAFFSQNSIDIGQDEKDVKATAKAHKQAKQAGRDAERFYAERNILFDPVFRHVRLIGQLLKSLHVSSEKHLGAWGYTIDDSPRPARERIATIKPGSSKTIRQIKTGSTLRNTGMADLLLHKGKTKGGQIVTLLPESSYVIPYGWSISTLENQNNRETGQITFLSTHYGR